MKIKAKTKKILVLSVMVVLLVATGVLNFVLNDRLDSTTNPAGVGDGSSGVTETFFASCKSEREAMRESEFLCLDAIAKSEENSKEAREKAEHQRLELVKRMELENQLETMIKAKGFEDAIVTVNENGVNVVVTVPELDAQTNAKIKSVVTTYTDFKPIDVKIIPYN